MKRFLLFVLILLPFLIQAQKPNEYPDLKGDYLGQSLPGDTPEVFAPGIISVDSTIEHGSPTFSPDGTTVFWQSNLRHPDKETEIFLWTMHREDSLWSAPEISPYGGMPAYSPDGNQLFFLPLDTEKEKGLYYATRQGEKWSEPISMNLIARFPELKYLYGPSLTTNGTLYFFAHVEGSGTMNDFGIYRSEFVDGAYAKPELLPSVINAEGALNWTPFISPDESYLLFSSNRSNNQQDIYISHRQSDGSWMDPINLGTRINTDRGERFPYVSPDGKYLFFTRWVDQENEDIMWVSSAIIDEINMNLLIDKNLSYEEFEAEAIRAFRNNNIDYSIIIMEYAYKNFPEEFARTTEILAYIYTRTNTLSKAIEIWRTGMDKGYMYDLNNPYYQENFKDNADFEALAQIEKSMLDTLHLKYEIVLPTEYDNKKMYPILFVFHGNNRNIEKSKISWNAPIMEREFITVFLQSYIPSSPTNFKWVSKDEKIKKEFTEIYDQILKDYPVNESKIIFAGMSAGGKKAMDFTLNNYFPVSGLVLNCPVPPQDITDEMTRHFVETNKKIGIITGENDFALDSQKSFMSKIDSLGGQTRITVTEGLGHSFADNFTEMLNEYLGWVIE
ncbi:MAG: hypothetical protein K9H13_12920 [Bacteroidales bacterium]|nr:hypothetical protein [Bacteroidales bacterium]MCF8345531.1 hypothetical protein [Bacteroidales bacterium]MCF8350159.1 hypothetical protein [Bacteroidales bacterium]